MIKKLLLTLTILVVFNSAYPQQNNNVENKQKKTYTKKQNREIRKKNEFHLANNKIKKHFNISRSERKAADLPLNHFFEKECFLTLNPKKERVENTFPRIHGKTSDNNWTERAPNNVGGHTKAIIFHFSETKIS